VAPERDHLILRGSGCQLRELSLNSSQIEVTVFPSDASAFDRKDIHAIANNVVAILARSHLVLADEMSGADMHALAVESDVWPLFHRSSKRLAHGGQSNRRLTTSVKMEHRVIGMHRHDLVEIVRRPSFSVANSKLLNVRAYRDPPQ
jgi:hypothetical protein